jgi:hypothetical protein
MIHEPVIIEKAHYVELMGRIEKLELAYNERKHKPVADVGSDIIRKEEVRQLTGFSFHYIGELRRKGELVGVRLNGKEYGYSRRQVLKISKFRNFNEVHNHIA